MEEAAEHDVVALFEAADYEVTRAVGLTTGTADLFVRARTGLAPPRTYVEVVGECPTAFEEALGELEKGREARKADRALLVVMRGALPAGYETDLDRRTSTAITYRRLLLELTGILRRVREAVKRYEEEGKAKLYVRRRASTSTGAIVDAVDFIKEWVQAGRGNLLGVIGPPFSGRSTVISQAAYEIGVELGRDLENVVPLAGSYGSADDMVWKARVAVEMTGFPFESPEPRRRVLRADAASLPHVARADVLEIQPPDSADIETWFTRQLSGAALGQRLLEARRRSVDFKRLSDAPATWTGMLSAITTAPASPDSVGEWIAHVTSTYLSAALLAPGYWWQGGERNQVAPALEDAALEDFALGGLKESRPLAGVRRHHLLVAELANWFEIDPSPSVSLAVSRFTNRLVRDYFLARRIARDVRGGDLSILTRYQFPKEYVLLFLAVVSPDAAAEVGADRLATLRAEMEAEIERRLHLTLAHQLKRSAGMVGAYVQLIEPLIENIDPEIAAAIARELAGIRDEAAFQARLAEQTRIWHEVPTGPVEALSPYEILTSLAVPLRKGHPTVTLILDVSPALRVSANRDGFREILHCLLENAFHASLAASKPATPRVAVRSNVEGANVRLDISDNGRGIAAGDRENIFAPYVTTKKGGDGRPLGTGLGLAIARRYAEAVGGRVDLDADRPETCFTARFVLSKDPP